MNVEWLRHPGPVWRRSLTSNGVLQIFTRDGGVVTIAGDVGGAMPGLALPSLVQWFFTRHA